MIKKILAGVLTICACLPIPPINAEDNDELNGQIIENIYIDGREYTYNTNTWYLVDNKFIDFNSNGIQMASLKTTVPDGDVNLMPIRGISEALGGTIYGSDDPNIYRIVVGKKYAIDIKVGDVKIDVLKPIISYNIDSYEYSKTITASVPPVEYNDTIYLPFRDVIRALFVPDGTYKDTDRYINVTEIVKDCGFYRIYVSTEGKFNIKHKKEFAHDITIITKEKTYTVSVAKDAHNVNFEKYLYRVFVGDSDVKNRYLEYKNACCYALDRPGTPVFKSFSSSGTVRPDQILYIADKELVKNGKLKEGVEFK